MLSDRCATCPLKGKPVPGKGPLDAKIVIVGEAPGQEEERSGEPFVGKSGIFLNKHLGLVGLKREDIHVTNVVCCRPPNNRTPLKSEIEACKPLLFQTLKEIKPKVVIPLGNTPLEAIENMIGIKARSGVPKWMGEYWSIPAIHPSWYLRQGEFGSENFTKALAIAKDFAYGTGNPVSVDYKILNNPVVLFNWIDSLTDGQIKRLTLDIETQNLDRDTEILGLGLGTGEGKGYYIPLYVSSFFKRRVSGDKKVTTLTNIEKFWGDKHDNVVKAIGQILTSGSFKFSTFVGHFDLLHNKVKYGDILDFSDNWVFDCFYANYLLDENKMEGTRDLDTATMKYPDLAGYKDKTKGIQDFSTIPLELLADRCERDCDGTYRETVRLAKEIKDADLDFMMYNFMMPVGKLFVDMMYKGVYIDQDYLKKFGKELDVEIAQLTQEIHKIAGRNFNIDSGDQLADVLFNQLRVGEPTSFTDGGKDGSKKRPSTDADALRVFDSHPIIPKVLARAKLVKTKSTYVEGYGRFINPNTGRIHAYLKIAYGTTTGRPASRDPNLLNLDRRSHIRRIVSAPPGKGLVIADVSQAEIRVLAVESRDPMLLQAYWDGMDIHCYNVSVCFDMDYNKVFQLYKTLDKHITLLRTGMKHTLTFGALYGMGDDSLAEEIQRDGELFKDALVRAKQYKKIWTEKFSGVAKFKERVYNEVKKNQFLRNVYGRYRRLPEAVSSSKEEQSHALRQAFNFLIQSAASDMTLLYMVQIWDEIKRRGWQEHCYPVLTVYDSVVFECDFDYMLEVGQIYKDVFSQRPWPEFDIPVEIDIDYDKSWKKPITYHLNDYCIEKKGDGHIFTAPDSRIPERNWCKTCLEKAFS